MKSTFSKGWLSILVVLGVLMIDQIVKIEVKTNMSYGENIRITDWFYIHFVENNGMAFGMQIMPKVIQTVLRILFSGIIIWYISILAKANYKRGYIVCVSLILAGAIGNIIDSIFYGVIFSKSTFTEIATFVPLGHGYADWLYGKVVDMLHFPLFEFNWPDWIPFIGGNHFLFFSPVFNIADAAISCGIFILILFYSKSFSNSYHLAKTEFRRLLKK
ncbi:MAG: lipoprotein signal peptidase [Bacteroides oleiciplenus]|nr:lipoprotein signal peptidase [Bacteroides oleiciplenus]